MSDTDIVIVGGGPVGLGLALDLALHDCRVLVLERSTEPHRIPKGQNLTQRSGELFRRWGIGEQIRRLSPIPRAFGNAGLVTYGNLLSEYHYDWFQRSKVAQYYFAENERLPQYLLEQAMRERLKAFTQVSFEVGCHVTSLEQSDDSVSVRFERGGKTHSLCSTYLVGCDGARSTVRTQANIAQTTRLEGPRMVLLVFRSTELDQLLSQYPGKSIFNVMNPELGGYWQFLGRYDLDGGWFFHMPVDDHIDESEDSFKRLLHKVAGRSFDLQFEHIGYWDLRISHAEQYQTRRIFIAGDAAHSHPPYGGYGVNTGLEDAANLSWKLAAQIKGWGSEALLDSYSLERHAVFDSVSRDFIERMIEDFRSFMSNHSPQKDKDAFDKAWHARANADDSDVTEFLPNYAGSPIIWGEDGSRSSALGQHQTQARPGYHLSPLPSTEQSEDPSNTFTLLAHGGFTLLNFDGSQERASKFSRAFQQRNIPLRIMSEPDQSAIACYQANAILVRPDLYVAWTDNTNVTDATDILKRLVPSAR